MRSFTFIDADVLEISRTTKVGSYNTNELKRNPRAQSFSGGLGGTLAIHTLPVVPLFTGVVITVGGPKHLTFVYQVVGSIHHNGLHSSMHSHDMLIAGLPVLER